MVAKSHYLVPPQNDCITILHELNCLVLSHHILLPNSNRDLRILLTDRISQTYLFQVLINPVHVITQDADAVRTRHVTAHVLTITSAERNHLYTAEKCVIIIYSLYRRCHFKYNKRWINLANLSLHILLLIDEKRLSKK